MQEFYNRFNLWLPSPLQKINFPDVNYTMYVKRDDLIHWDISGNKFRKLKYNLIEYFKGGYNGMVAFGGAFSNLLYTLSVISAGMNIPMTFYIRGDGYDPRNPTLRFIKSNGVKMVFMSRKAFKELREQGFEQQMAKIHPGAYIIPEGGSNSLAVPGSAEIVKEIVEQLHFPPEHIVMDLGTGGTFAGVLSALPPETKLTGIAALKGVDWNKTLSKILGDKKYLLNEKNWTVTEDYHFGGFAKFDLRLIDFINNFKRRYGIPLDPIYTGKLVYGLFDLIDKKYFDEDTTIVWVHGGGLQGIAGFNYIHGELVK